MIRSGINYKNLLASLLFILMLNASASAQQIVIDGNTNTTLTVNGKITDVTTTTVKGVNAFNSFSKFNVDTGNTVNLVIPNNSQRLINVVNGKASTINGILNSVQNSLVGRGNIYLLNPEGIIIGSKGQINTGALTLLTPTKDFVDTFFDSPGKPNDVAVNTILVGSTPINIKGVISNAGTITGQTRIDTNSGTLINSGTIKLSDVVNVDKVVNGQVIGQYNGDLVIKTLTSLNNSGTFNVDGVNNLDAGNISITNGDTLNLYSGSKLTAKGTGVNSSGGTISLLSSRTRIEKTNLSGKDITINPTNFLNFNSGNIEATGLLTINSGTIKDYGIVFFPDSIQTNTFTSDFLKQNDNLYLISNTDLTLGNFDNITINSQPLNINNINFSSNTQTTLTGDITTVGNVVLSSPWVNTYNLNLGANNVTFDASYALRIIGGNINAAGAISLYARDLSQGDLMIAPNSITAQSIKSNFLAQNAPLNINKQYNSIIFLQNLDNFMINGSRLNPSNININNNGLVCLSGAISTNGDLTIKTNTTAGGIYFNSGLHKIGNETFNFANPIITGRNINLSSNVINIEGQLTSNSDSTLLVNANNTIDLSSDINASIIKGSVYVFNTTQKHGIYLTTKNLSGQNGNLRTMTGNQNINITNNSSNNLLLHNVSGSITGEIVLNGKKQTKAITTPSGTIDVTYVNTGIAQPQINITNTTAKDILLAGNILNTNGIINITNTTGNILTSSELSTIYSKNTTLSAVNGTIGTTKVPVNVFTKDNSQLNATASGIINLLQPMGNLLVSRIESTTNDVYLSSGNAGIIDVSVGQTANVLGRNILLYAPEGSSIGLNNDPVDVTLNGGLMLVSGYGFININSLNSDLEIGRITNDGKGLVKLSSTGSILDGITKATNPTIICKSLELNAQNGDIGSSDNFLKIDTVGTSSKNTVKATSSANIYLSETSGNLFISQLTNSGHGTIAVESLGSIMDGVPKSGADIISKDIYLLSTAGSIGTPGLPLNTNINKDTTGGILFAQALNDINISNTGGDLFINGIRTLGGADVNLTCDNGIIDQGAGIIGKNINLYAVKAGTIGLANTPLNVNFSRLSGKLTAMGFGLINITSNNNKFANNDLPINVISNLGRGDVILNALGDIYDASAGELPNIYAKGISLTSVNKSISRFNNSLDIALNYNNAIGGELTANANVDILLSSLNGNLNIEKVSSTKGNVTLYSAGSILDTTATQTPSITAKNLSLIALKNGSTVGTNVNPLDINLSTGSLKVQSAGYINVNETAGIFLVDLITNAGKADVKLTGAEGISGINRAISNNLPYIYSRGLDLVATQGPITFNSVYTNYNSTGGTLTATSPAGNINITQYAGNLNLNTITTTGDVSLQGRAGGIYTQTTLPTINITADNLNIYSPIAIGTTINPVEIEVTGAVKANSPDTHIHQN